MSLTNITLPYNNNAGGEAAVGTILSLGTVGSPTTYLPIGNMGNIKWNLKVKTADVTNQGTNWTRAIPTLYEGGTITGDLHFVPNSANTATIEGHSFATGLGSVFTQGTIAPWKLVFPDGTTWYLNGFITDFPIDANLEKDLMCAITITVVGEPTFA